MEMYYLHDIYNYTGGAVCADCAPAELSRMNRGETERVRYALNGDISHGVTTCSVCGVRREEAQERARQFLEYLGK
jgi:hypothetical protein